MYRLGYPSRSMMNQTRCVWVEWRFIFFTNNQGSGVDVFHVVKNKEMKLVVIIG
jgi:hypothetical protein